MAITATRLRILESQQTGITKKVYAAVPIVEPWSSTDIANELHRTGGLRDLRMIEGCLNTLKDVGIIKEPSPKHFQRVKPKTKPEKECEDMATAPMNPAPAPKKQKSSEEKMAELSVSLRQLSQQLAATADLLDDITLELEEGNGAVLEELTNLRQLKDMLKKVLL